jgi:hypothetical protein
MKQLAQASNWISDWGLGTPGLDLQTIMQVYKPNTQLDWGCDFQKVLDLLGQGRPVIALVGWGEVDFPVTYGPVIVIETVPEVLHYVTLTGYDMQTQQIFYTDTDGVAKAFSFAEFQDKWDWTATGQADAVLSAMGIDKKTILW